MAGSTVEGTAIVPAGKVAIASANHGCLAPGCPEVDEGVEAKRNQGTISDTTIETKYRLLELL